MAAIIHDGRDVQEFCNEAFTIHRYMQTYAYSIQPMIDEKFWPHEEGDIVHPPIVRPQAGRPKKARKKDIDERNRDGTNLVISINH